MKYFPTKNFWNDIVKGIEMLPLFCMGDGSMLWHPRSPKIHLPRRAATLAIMTKAAIVLWGWTFDKGDEKENLWGMWGQARARVSKKGKLGAIEYQVGFGRLMALSMAFSNFICLRFSQTAGSAEACGLSQGETKCHEDRPSKAWVALHHATVSIDTRIRTTQLQGIFGLVLIDAAWGLWNLNWVLKH